MLSAQFLLFLTFLNLYYVTSVELVIEDSDDEESSKDLVTFAESAEFPFTVQLEIKIKINNVVTIEFCGGVIIRRNVILTAAHCLPERKNGKILNIFAIAGIVNIKTERDFAQRIAVKTILIHQQYADHIKTSENKEGYFYNDIAIIWLRTAFKITKSVKIAELQKTNMRVEGKEGYIPGWGSTECGEFSVVLKKAKLKGISICECRRIMTTIDLTNKVFCVVDDSKSLNTSIGDYGGAFVYDGVVLGLSSFGVSLKAKNSLDVKESNCDLERPSVFTNIFKYIDWIRENIKTGVPTADSCRDNLNNCFILD